MNRLLRRLNQLISCLFLCFITCMVSHVPVAAADTSRKSNKLSGNSTTPATDKDIDKHTKKSAQKSSVNKNPKVAAHASAGKTLMLVPPPPPGQVSLLDWPGITDMSGSINYLNADELKIKLEHMHKQIDNAKHQLSDNDARLAESKDKAERFHALYDEGVVSRKELEEAKKEADDMERLVGDAKGDLNDLELQEGAIVRQLNHLKGNTKTSHQRHFSKKHQEQKP